MHVLLREREAGANASKLRDGVGWKGRIVEWKEEAADWPFGLGPPLLPCIDRYAGKTKKEASGGKGSSFQEGDGNAGELRLVLAPLCTFIVSVDEMGRPVSRAPLRPSCSVRGRTRRSRWS